MSLLAKKLRMLGADPQMQNAYRDLSLHDRQQFVNMAMQDEAVRKALTVLIIVDGMVSDEDVEGMD